MSKQQDNDARTAFPMLGGDADRYDSDPGMSMREYFAAHAPAEPQPWFEPTMLTPRPMRPKAPSDRIAKVLGESLNAGADPTRDWVQPPLSDAEWHLLQAYEQNLSNWHGETDKWDRERARERYIQWPWAWADAVLAQRNVIDASYTVSNDVEQAEQPETVSRDAVLDLRNEISCRIEHGAESGGHLEYVLSQLDAIIAKLRTATPDQSNGQAG